MQECGSPLQQLGLFPREAGIGEAFSAIVTGENNNRILQCVPTLCLFAFRKLCDEKRNKRQILLVSI